MSSFRKSEKDKLANQFITHNMRGAVRSQHPLVSEREPAHFFLFKTFIFPCVDMQHDAEHYHLQILYALLANIMHIFWVDHCTFIAGSLFYLNLSKALDPPSHRRLFANHSTLPDILS